MKALTKIMLAAVFAALTGMAQAVPLSTLTVGKECFGQFCGAWAGQGVSYSFTLLFDYSDSSGLSDTTESFSLGFGGSKTFQSQRQDTTFVITEMLAFNAIMALNKVESNTPINEEQVGLDYKVTVQPTTIGFPADLTVTFFNEPGAPPQDVPVPAPLALFGLGMLALAWTRGTRAKA